MCGCGGSSSYRQKRTIEETTHKNIVTDTLELKARATRQPCVALPSRASPEVHHVCGAVAEPLVVASECAATSGQRGTQGHALQ